jgi:hypothetical protein
MAFHMPAKRNCFPETTKPATPSEQRAISAFTNDDLKKTRENTNDRAEVNKQKTPQGKSNRG